jgi:GDP-4-dehydro-6-deoxy-D-mannose reductase
VEILYAIRALSAVAVEGRVRALITGISGFVGSHLAEYLLSHSCWKVAGTVYGPVDTITHLKDRLALYPAELSQPAVVHEVLQAVRPDYIFHLAAQPSPTVSRADPWFTLENNIRVQLNILEAVAQMGSTTRVLVVGSGDEYGVVWPNDLPIDEDTPLRPATPYAVSKVAQDYLGLQYFLSHKVATIRVRPFNHMGPRQGKGFVAADFASQIAEIEAGLRSPEIRVGTLDVSRDLSDVRDIVRGYYLALTQGEPGEVYNLGAEQDHTIRALLETLLSLARLDVRIVQDPSLVRPAEVPCVVSDCRKLRARTGWRAEIPIEQSLRDILDYWRERVRAEAKL